MLLLSGLLSPGIRTLYANAQSASGINNPAGKVLTIWVSPSVGIDGLQQIGDEFEQSVGTRIYVDGIANLEQAFESEAMDGGGPDIVIAAHDQIQHWAIRGLLAPLDISAVLYSDIFPYAWAGMRFDGDTYGYPINAETLVLIYNRSMLEKPPGTLSEIAALSLPDGVIPIAWPHTSSFFTWPFLRSSGAFTFGYTDGKLDLSRTGIHTDQTVIAVEKMAALKKEGLIHSATSREEVVKAFRDRKVAMIVDGPWSLADLEKSGLRLGVAPIPRMGRQDATPFFAVRGISINRASPFRSLSRRFIEEFVLSSDGLSIVDENQSLGAVVVKSYQRDRTTHPWITTQLQGIAQARISPAFPKDVEFWGPMDNALRNVFLNDMPARQALDRAAATIRHSAGAVAGLLPVRMLTNGENVSTLFGTETIVGTPVFWTEGAGIVRKLWRLPLRRARLPVVYSLPAQP